MAKKRHGGLGRGLNALIPQERPQESTESIKEEKKSDTPVEQQSVNEPAETADQIMRAEPSKDNAEQQLSYGDFVSDKGVRTLRLSQIDPNRSQPRQNFEDEALEELADSIRQFGVLQPILVQKKGNRYEIIAGERRWRASRKAGLTEIPAIIRDYSDQETLELSLIENIQRQDLNPIEEAKAFRRLLDEFQLRQEDLAARVSKSRTAITNSVRLLKLDERVQDMLTQGQLSMGHARALIPVEIGEEQYLIAQQIAEKQLSVRDVEKLIKKRNIENQKKKDTVRKQSEEKDEALELAYREIEERLKQSLGTKTSIRNSGDGRGKLEIEFYSHEDLEKIVDMLT